MSSFRFLFFVALLATLGLARPASVGGDVQKRSFQVPRLINPRHPGPNGAAAMRRVFRKYSLVPKEDMMDMAGLIGNTTNSDAKAQPSTSTGGSSTPPSTGGKTTGTVAAIPEDMTGSIFLSPVTVGGQKLNLDFDTGSSDLWMFSTQLPKAQIGQHTIFDPTKSTTFQAQPGLAWNISYGDGSGASGSVGTDTVTIGGVTMMNQTVELAQNVSQSFQMDMMNDGLVGMAFSKLNTVNMNGKKIPQSTFFNNVMNKLALPLFCANLMQDGSGAYDFGSIDTTQFVGQMAWTLVDSASGFWQFPSTKYQIGNGKVVAAQNPSLAIADTGTSLMLVDQPVADAYYATVQNAVNVPQAGGYVFPCGTTLPDFSVAAGDNMIKIPGKVLNFAPVDQQGQVCFGGIQGNMGAGMQIYGDVMFRAQYVAFNGGNSSLGFGQKAI